MSGGYWTHLALENLLVEGSKRAETLEAFWEAFGGQEHVLEIDFVEHDVMTCRDCRCVSCSKPSTCMLRVAPLRRRHRVVYALPSCQYVHSMLGRGRLCVGKSNAGGM
jgi:hypothetical protein